MSKFDSKIYNYVRIDGDSLRNINFFTKGTWDIAVKKGDIIDITKKDDKEKCYLVDISVYLKLIQSSKTEESIDPYGIPNVNFTLIKPSDARWEDFKQQRLERGFDSSELWSLDMTIANFILPRLKAFKEEHCSYPAYMSEEEWDVEMDKMIKAFEYIKDENLGRDSELNNDTGINNRDKVIEEGLKSFCDNFSNLWD